MKIKITGTGIFGAGGELAIGTELEVAKEPTGWAGRYVIVSADPADDAELVVAKEPEKVVAPAKAEPEKAAPAAKPDEPAKAKPAAVSVARKGA